MLKALAMTDIGRKRMINQDYVFACEQPIGKLPNLFVVADGMGGHNAGDFASKYTVETIVENVKESADRQAVVILRKAIEAANEQIRMKAGQESAFQGMGTTVVAAVLNGNQMEVANVGDSRLYLVNDTITQITKDHSLVEEMVRMGGIDREEARNHPDKNIITRAVGVESAVEVDFFEVELKAGDKVLMCSDGLTNMLEDEKILSVIQSQPDIDSCVKHLIDAANENGGRDNIAVLLIELVPDENGEKL